MKNAQILVKLGSYLAKKLAHFISHISRNFSRGRGHFFSHLARNPKREKCACLIKSTK